MSMFLSHVSLLTASFAAGLGNYWFTFGLWPQSWFSFTGFWFLGVLITGCQFALHQEQSKEGK